jgi:hypothetical protein
MSPAYAPPPVRQEHVVPCPDGSLTVLTDCPKGNLKSRAVWVVKLAPSKGLSVSHTMARPIRPRSVRMATLRWELGWTPGRGVAGCQCARGAEARLKAPPGADNAQVAYSPGDAGACEASISSCLGVERASATGSKPMGHLGPGLQTTSRDGQSGCQCRRSGRTTGMSGRTRVTGDCTGQAAQDARRCANRQIAGQVWARLHGSTAIVPVASEL